MLPLILSNNKTRLRKDNNLCFVNATLQVLYNIEEVRELFQAVHPSEFPDSWPISRELCRVFESSGTHEISASELRRIVGVVSGRLYLANGGQQDMEEFFRILLSELEAEVSDDDGLFSPSLENFWGKEVTIRKFVNMSDGKCVRCKMFPAYKEDKFLTLKLKVPESNDDIMLSQLISSYYPESAEQMVLRCGICCTHTASCPQIGPCKSHNAVTQVMMTKSPKYLIVQLMRFEGADNGKKLTNVTPGKVLQLP